MTETKTFEIWGIPTADGSWERAVFMDSGDLITQAKLEARGYEFWRFNTLTVDDNGQIVAPEVVNG